MSIKKPYHTFWPKCFPRLYIFCANTNSSFNRRNHRADTKMVFNEYSTDESEVNISK